MGVEAVDEDAGDRRQDRRLFLRDVIGSSLFVGPGYALVRFFAFIAAARLNAPNIWIGIISSGIYSGFVWNLFFSSLTARLSIRKSIVVIMIVSAGFLSIAAFQRTTVPYCLLVLCFNLAFGLFEVQYNTYVHHIYRARERPRLLSHRYFAVSVSLALSAAFFGKITESALGHLPAFLAAAFMMGLGVLFFRSMRSGGEHIMDRFGPRDVFTAIYSDQRLGRVAVLLSVYGWSSIGSYTLLALLYARLMFSEWQVGILSAALTVGAIFATLFFTPRISFQGGISNFRLCFVSSAAGVALFVFAAIVDLGPGAFPFMVVANFIYGVSSAGFVLATQTTAINLAPPGKTALYVNALMVIQGGRGLATPLLMILFLNTFGMIPALVSALAVGLLCAAAVYLPGIDGALGGAQTETGLD